MERRPKIKDVSSILSEGDDNGAMLKRAVRIKTIVTEKFKQEMEKNLKMQIERLDKTIEQIDKQTKPYIEDFKKKGKAKQLESLNQQVAQEKGKLALQKKVLAKKIEDIKKLVLGSEFVQGTMESWVNIKVGDNLFKKVGGMEILVKDGIVQEIRKT